VAKALLASAIENRKEKSAADASQENRTPLLAEESNDGIPGAIVSFVVGVFGLLVVARRSANKA
jgi:hypothetical protein